MKRIFLLILSLLFMAVFTFFFFKPPSKPRLSIITSLYKGDLFIKGFMENITAQTIFPQCELIIINANSPGNEEVVIRPYLKRYPNITYVKLDQDPGLYGTWNLAVRMASADFITNANLDDRSRKDSYEVHVAELEAHPEIDLVYSGYYITVEPNKTFETGSFEENPLSCWCDPPEFVLEKTYYCLPGPRPLWRKSLHGRFGYFDETFTVVSDWAFWIRVACRGAKFKKVPGFYTIYYQNPEGISTTNDPERQRLAKMEVEYISLRYHKIWNDH